MSRRFYWYPALAFAALLPALTVPAQQSEATEITLLESSWDAAADRGYVVAALAQGRLRCEVQPRGGNPDGGYRLWLTSETPIFKSSETGPCFEAILRQLKQLGCDLSSIRMIYLPRLLESDLKAKLGSALSKARGTRGPGLSNSLVLDTIQKTALFDNYKVACQKFGLTVTPHAVETIGLFQSEAGIKRSFGR